MHAHGVLDSFRRITQVCSPIWMPSHSMALELVTAPDGQNWSHSHKFINEAKILPAEHIHSAPLLHKDLGGPSQNWSHHQVNQETKSLVYWYAEVLFQSRLKEFSYTNLSRDITLPTKVCLVKAMVFPVVMYGCESWTVKKAERRRIDAVELWCWRRLLRVPWTARRSNPIHSKWGWWTGTTQRDGTGREEGGGFRMGNTCLPVADSCWCMAKPIQYCKVINIQLK